MKTSPIRSSFFLVIAFLLSIPSPGFLAPVQLTTGELYAKLIEGEKLSGDPLFVDIVDTDPDICEPFKPAYFIDESSSFCICSQTNTVGPLTLFTAIEGLTE